MFFRQRRPLVGWAASREKNCFLLLFFHNYYLWGGKDPESDDNALWKMGGFLGYSSSIVWAIFFRKVLKKLEFVPLFCVFLIQKFWINESSCNKKKETDAIMKLFLFFIISTWTNGSFVTNFSKQYSMRSNVSIKHVS